MDNQTSSEFDNSNIFDELTQDVELENSLKKMKETKDKNFLYYISFYSGILKSINYVLLIVFLLSFTYIFIQKSETFYQSSYLNLFCPVLLGDVSNYVLDKGENCSGLSVFKSRFVTDEVGTLKNTQYNKIIDILPDVYVLNNNITSKERVFLLDETKNRLKVSDILKDFDELKGSFISYDKGKLECGELSIDSDYNIKVACSTFSSDWDDDILGYDGNDKNQKVKGTSIAIASSFLNYIQTSSTKFTLLNKQKSFNLLPLSEGLYKYETDFSIELKYNGTNLSF
nr:hypothetical protein [Candidatus Gracilibacteria bacterium]